MKVHVRVRGAPARLVVARDPKIECPSGCDVAGLLARIGAPSAMRWLIWRNGGRLGEPSVVRLRPGDVVEVLAPVSGGAGRSPYLDEGIRLFRTGEYFLAHETLEEHWLDAEAADRDFLQGLIHLAVAFHHYRRGNLTGARLQFRKGASRLGGYSGTVHGVDVDALRLFLEEAPERLARGDPVAPPELEPGGAG